MRHTGLTVRDLKLQPQSAYTSSVYTHPSQKMIKSRRFVVCLLLLLLSEEPAGSFTAPSGRPATRLCWMQLAAKKKKGRGFADSTTTTTTKSSSHTPPPPPRPSKMEDSYDGTNVARPKEQLNAGQRALQKLRTERQVAQNDELRRMQELQATDAALSSTPATIPEKVAQRMGSRMLPFVGLPLFLGMGVFVGFWYMATYKNIEFETSLVAASTIAVLVLSLMGITYSVMSASWDEDREGSFFGTDEFARNVDNIKQGLGRSKENAILRERMQEPGMQTKLQQLESAGQQHQSLGDKRRDEMEQ